MRSEMRELSFESREATPGNNIFLELFAFLFTNLPTKDLLLGRSPGGDLFTFNYLQSSS